MTDWQRILVAADKGTEIAEKRRENATSMKERNHWLRRENRLDQLAQFAMLAIEFNHV